MSNKGKCLDILMVGITLEQVTDIAKRLPKLKIMINHLSGLDLGKADAVNDAWKKAIQACAEYPNVYMKVSGIFQRAASNPANLNLEFYKPCLDHLVENFGEDRLVYGSNWPVLNRYGDYKQYKSLIMDFCSQYHRRFVEKLLYKNAVKFYNLPELKL